MQPERFISCRLCGASARLKFELRSAPAGRLTYYHCHGCGSLQTQAPTWLNAAYRDGALGQLDTGALYRSQMVAARVWALSKVLRLDRSCIFLDVGGGNGVLARLLRDLSFDAYVEDPNTADLFNRPFVLAERTPNFITAIEVLEHLKNPSQDLPTVFERSAKHVLVSTRRYVDQGPDWYYLAPEGAQHVFFYSDGAFELIGEMFGYHVEAGDEFTLFSSAPLSGAARALFRVVSHPASTRLTMAYLSLLGRSGRMADQRKIIDMLHRPS